MKKILYTLLSISILLVSLAIAGCGSDGDKYLGTWELKTDNDRANYYVIEKGDNSDSYLVTYYYIDTENKKIKVKNTQAGRVNDGILVSDGLNHILKDGKLVTNKGNSIYNKVNDKPMSADKILETSK